MSFGILYIASGIAHLKEAIFNASYVRKHFPDIPISLKTDQPNRVEIGLFDNLLELTDPTFSYRDKITGLLDLPYAKTLFLDTDARLIHPLSNIHDLFHTYDISGCYAPVRTPPGWVCTSCPNFFPEVNTGVLFLRRKSIVKDLIDSWLSLYDHLLHKYRQSWDQASFRSVLWSYIKSHNINFNSLPPEFNIRTTQPWIVGRGSPAYIVHGRYNEDEFDLFARYLNLDVDKFRTYSIWLDMYPDSSIRPRFDRTFS